MEKLYNLANPKIHNQTLLDVLIGGSSNSPISNLRHILFSDEILTDFEVMIKIYGVRNDPAFYELKSKMKSILVKSIVTQQGFIAPNYSRNFEGINAYRETLVGRILFGFKERNVAIELVETSIKTSIKYEITENVISQCKMLIDHYGTSIHNKYKFIKYSKILDKYLYYYNIEIKAQKYACEIMHFQSRILSNIQSEDEIYQFKEYIDELDLYKDVPTYSFNFEKFRLNCAYYEFLKDYTSVLKLCAIAEKGFGKQEFVTETVLSSIFVRKLWALIQANRLNECIAIGKRLIIELEMGSLIWYLIGIYLIKAYIYTQKYTEALELLLKLLGNRGYKYLSNSIQEIFQLTLGYLHLVYFKELTDKTFREQIPIFKVGKFLNTVPTFSKDKRGINVSILILHASFLIQRKKFDEAIDRIESLNRYAGRYLRRDDTFRSNCMIKMLVQMAKADFHPIKTERYAAKLRAQLDQFPVTGSGGNIEVEIIPFEVIWEVLIKSIQPVRTPTRRRVS